MERVHVESEIEKEILNAYEDGLSLRAVAKKMGCSHIHVWKTMKKLRPNVLRPQRNPRKYHFIDDYFSDYTEENSYWMGFISADGHVGVKRGRIEIKIHSKDIDRLIAFRNALNGDFPIYRYNTRPHVSVVMFSRKMVNDLIEKEIGPKASALRIPLNIPDTCARHFIRGCFDGDGSISLVQNVNGRSRPLFQIIGTEHPMKWIQAKLIEQAQVNSHVRLRSGDGCWALRIESWGYLPKLRDYLYNDVAEPLYMKRKKEKFELCFMTRENPLPSRRLFFSSFHYL